MDRQPGSDRGEPPGVIAYVTLALVVISGIAGFRALYTGWANLW